MTQANETALGRTLDRVLFWLTVATLTGGVLLLLAMPGRADSCAVRARPVVVAQAAAVVQPAAVVSHAAAVLPVAVFQPIAVAVPTYTAAYTPTPAPAPAHGSPGHPDAKALLEALRAIEARLQALEGKSGSRPTSPAPASPAAPPPMPPANDPFNPPAASSRPAATAGKAPAVFSTKCAQCHARGKEDAGGGLVLLEADGSAAKLDARAALATARRSYNGTMPPRSSKIPPLTDEEVSEIMGFVDVK